MLRPLPLLFALAVLALPLSAQSGGVVTGRVVTATTGAPLSGVTVEHDGGSRRAVTNAMGAFRLTGLPAGRVTLRFQRLGFQGVERTVDLGSGEASSLEVVLPLDAVGVDPLVVLARRTRMVGDPAAGVVTPGSAHFLSRIHLEEQPLMFDNVHSALRRIPGVNVQEEEGFGLRPNIGLRGTGSERSSKVTLMEDGVLIAPAPYSSPSAYYTPTMGRMEAIEVRKGSSQVRYGPRTTGGAINFLSTGVPVEGRVLAGELGGGAHGSFKARGSAGWAGDHVGFLVETYQLSTAGFKQLQTGGETGYRLQDYLGKVRLNTDRDAPLYQEVVLKAGYVDQLSDETYLGITAQDFAATPLLRYAGSALDQMDNDHRQLQLRHFLRAPGGFDLTTTLYRNDFARNWYKLQSVSGRGLSTVLDDPGRYPAELAILRGGSSPDGALVLRANNREYMSRGIQTVLGVRGSLGGSRHDLEVGVRFHQDDEDRFQWEDGYRMAGGTMTLTSAGVPGTQTNRLTEATAVAFFIQDEVKVGALTLTPGVRYETIDFTGTNWGSSDLERTGPGTVRETSVDAWVPGMGVAFEVSPRLNLFGGLHRGFGPPGAGADDDTRPEESWNWEAGTRFRSGTLNLEVAGFWSDYNNILGEETLASGTPGAGQLFNGGTAEALGIETLFETDLAEGRALPVRIPLQATWTWTRARFTNSFESDFEPWGNVTEGDALPYIPEHQFAGSLGVRGDRWGMSFAAHGSGEARTVAGEGAIPDGERTDRFLAFSLQGDVELPTGAVLFAGLENLSDERYIVARRPAGLRPGLPRTFQAGVRIRR